MPVKSQLDKPSDPEARQDKKRTSLIKREIKMPDGRYMIFYTDSASAKQEQASQK